MSYTTLSGKAKQALLNKAKRQRARAMFDMREDNRPVSGPLALRNLYAQLNRELFGNELPDNVKVGYNGRLRRYLGKAYYRIDSGGVLVPTKIDIMTNHRWTPRFLRKVMTHEMCHVWAYHFHNEDGHGKRFWSKMEELGYPKFHDWNDSQHYERDIYC